MVYSQRAGLLLVLSVFACSRVSISAPTDSMDHPVGSFSRGTLVDREILCISLNNYGGYIAPHPSSSAPPPLPLSTAQVLSPPSTFPLSHPSTRPSSIAPTVAPTAAYTTEALRIACVPPSIWKACEGGYSYKRPRFPLPMGRLFRP